MALPDSLPQDANTAEWLQLICRYYNGCTSGDVDLMVSTLHPDVVHWFLSPNRGSTPVRGAEHLARYWRKVTRMLQARWVVDSIVASGDEAVIEWTMFWDSSDAGARVATRGAEAFSREGGVIREIRSYYQMHDATTELDEFPYDERGYSLIGRESSPVHPDAGRFEPPR